MNNTSKTKIGFIGAGWITDRAHIPAFMHDDVQATLFCICDPDIKRAKCLAEKYKIAHVYGSAEELLASDVDAVIIATPNFTHYSLSLKALQAGKHVLCEKPIVLQPIEMDHIKNIALKKGKVFMPAFVNRFREDVILINKILSNKELGKLTRVRAGWLRKHGVPRPGTWITSKSLAGGGVLVDLGSHILDICLMLIGKENPIWSNLLKEYNYTHKNTGSAKWFDQGMKEELDVDVEDSVKASVNFEDALVVEVELSWMAPVSDDKTYFHIEGERGIINCKTLFGFSMDRAYKQDQITIRIKGEAPRRILLDRRENNTEKAFKNMASHFVDSINKNVRCNVTVDDAYRTISLIDKLYNGQ